MFHGACKKLQCRGGSNSCISRYCRVRRVAARLAPGACPFRIERPDLLTKLAIDTRMTITADAPVDMLLQFGVADLPEQAVEVLECSVGGGRTATIAAQEGIGQRIWTHFAGTIEVSYRAAVALTRDLPPLGEMATLPLTAMPSEAVPYLFESRYCPSARFEPFAASRFGETAGGKRVEAIHEWLARELAYVPGVSDARTDAADTFVTRQGVCRDYAHLLVALARASDIPARFVSCYAPGVTPPDFHAVAEVFLADPAMPGAGVWYPVDATGMARPHEIAIIGVGRDAADVSFMTSFGAAELADMIVAVTRCA
jgi:transglutaminase-like putative cysteine protease